MDLMVFTAKLHKMLVDSSSMYQLATCNFQDSLIKPENTDYHGTIKHGASARVDAMTTV